MTDMQLDDRKIKIMQAIIRNYLETGEPVGSRTISKYTDLNLSSATIRNEMADLEEMGYILQPHTSAGRIPSDKGYRLYVDTMMDEKTQEVQNMKEELESKAGKMDVLLRHMAKLLAANTNYASMVSGPTYVSKKVKFIQITSVEACQLLAVVVLDNNTVKNQMINIAEPLDEEQIVKLNFILNTALNGLDVMEMNLAVIQQIKEQVNVHSAVVDSILEVIGKTLIDQEEGQVYTSGTTNILKYPELADRSKAANLLEVFEEKKLLNSLIDPRDEDSKEETGIQVYIGDETNVESMKDCSVVTATYHIDEGVYGKIGIVGPKRMDYDKVVATLQSMMEELDDIFKEKS